DGEFGGEGVTENGERVTENGDFRDRSLLEDDGDPCLERLGSWLRRRDRTFIKSYNGDSLVGKKYECLSLLICSTELPLSHNDENLVVAVDDDGLFTERITHFISSEHQICMARRISKDHMELVVSFFCVVRRLKFVCVCPVRFLQVELLKELLLENNKQTHWIPDYVKLNDLYILQNP
ncbi:hypothetical protein HID58_064454, partial [Brassica napus]